MARADSTGRRSLSSGPASAFTIDTGPARTAPSLGASFASIESFVCGSGGEGGEVHPLELRLQRAQGHAGEGLEAGAGRSGERASAAGERGVDGGERAASPSTRGAVGRVAARALEHALRVERERRVRGERPGELRAADGRRGLGAAQDPRGLVGGEAQRDVAQLHGVLLQPQLRHAHALRRGGVHANAQRRLQGRGLAGRLAGRRRGDLERRPRAASRCEPRPRGGHAGTSRA